MSFPFAAAAAPAARYDAHPVSLLVFACLSSWLTLFQSASLPYAQSYSDSRFPGAYTDAERSSQLSYDCHPQSYGHRVTDGSSSGYVSYDAQGTGYRSLPSDAQAHQSFKQQQSYWRNGGDYPVPHQQPLAGQQPSFPGTSIAPQSLPASSPSLSSPSLTPHPSPTAHPVAWSPTPQAAAKSPAQHATRASSSSHPLQSLQQMVDPESSSGAQSFDRSQSVKLASVTGGAGCYAAGGDATAAGFPSYYNMDGGAEAGGSSQRQEEQVLNGSDDVNQKTGYYAQSSCSVAAADAPLNRDTSATTWNGAHWSGSGQWPPNGGTNGAASYAEGSDSHSAGSESQQPLQPSPSQPPQSQPQALAGRPVAAESQSWTASQEAAPSLALPAAAPVLMQKKKRGRPFGSKNKPKNPAAVAAAAAAPSVPGRKKPGRKPKAAPLLSPLSPSSSAS